MEILHFLGKGDMLRVGQDSRGSPGWSRRSPLDFRDSPRTGCVCLARPFQDTALVPQTLICTTSLLKPASMTTQLGAGGSGLLLTFLRYLSPFKTWNPPRSVPCNSRCLHEVRTQLLLTELVYYGVFPPVHFIKISIWLPWVIGRRAKSRILDDIHTNWSDRDFCGSKWYLKLPQIRTRT